MSAVERDGELTSPDAHGDVGAGGDLMTGSARELLRITRRLRLIGALVLVVTSGSFGVLLWSIAQSQYRYVSDAQFFALLNIAVAMSTVGLLGAFEVLRKRGDAIFQEMSDELQWYVGRSAPRDHPRGGSAGSGHPRGRSTLTSRESTNPQERPVFEARVALRTFSAAAELPLIPGRFGGAIYAALNLAVAIAAVLIFQASVA
jgi:hypothetical protein